MTKNINIELLSPVHIGSGEFLQYGNDFIIGQEEDDGDVFDVVYVTDLKKVMKLIGNNRISNWVSAIDRGDTIDRIVSAYAPRADKSAYSKRVDALYCKDQIRQGTTLKEQLHNGFGIPYIPGSSIKGAIRTAILPALINEKNISGHEIENLIYPIRQPKYAAKELEKRLFGNDPYHDIFRFLHTGDAYFGDNYEIVMKMVNVNKRERNGYRDESKGQLIEALGAGDTSSFKMSVDTGAFAGIGKKVPACMASFQDLFMTINAHTRQLLIQEQEIWEREEEYDENGIVNTYLDSISKILNEAEACKENSCILRIGHGSGWRFITGAWSESLDSFERNIVPAARRNNQNYRQYMFPKTRRIDKNDCDILGFVKLSF